MRTDQAEVFARVAHSGEGGGNLPGTSEGAARIGPISANVFFDFGVLFMSTITLPTNGKDFIAPVTISFDAAGTLDTPLQQPIGADGSADGHIKFDFVDGRYYPESFTQVPEPGTLGLLGVGLLGLAARVRNKFLHQS